jgi:hypothetical protein
MYETYSEYRFSYEQRTLRKTRVVLDVDEVRGTEHEGLSDESEKERLPVTGVVTIRPGGRPRSPDKWTRHPAPRNTHYTIRTY